MSNIFQFATWAIPNIEYCFEEVDSCHIYCLAEWLRAHILECEPVYLNYF